MCGEHWSQCRVCAPVEGSSPHVRGALVSSFIKTIQCGIIPACAGSTRLVLPLLRTFRDHPRMCGEHGGVNNYNNPTLGSSPHVRGAHAMTGEKTQVYGIIPACAGSTFDMIEILRQIGDHPRMCGEHVRRQSVRQLLTGIIPACAGSTQTHRLHDQPRRDHPRMCGEHITSLAI